MKIILTLSKIGLRYLFPLLVIFSSIFKLQNNRFLLFYIRTNNRLVKSNEKKYLPTDILILLPHCMQNSNCTYKVTSNINNCHKCFHCKIGDVKELAEHYKITSIEIVTGGTAARTIVQRINPKLIIAIACERDLASGIADIKSIPTIGIPNKRPNGPCYNTSIDMEELGAIFSSIIKKEA